MGDTIQISVLQVCNTRTCADTGTDCPAKRGQSTNADFLVDGGQICQGKRPIQRFFAEFQLLGGLMTENEVVIPGLPLPELVITETHSRSCPYQNRQPPHSRRE